MCSFGFISALFSQQSPSVWSSPGTRSVEGEQDWVPIYPARTSLRKRQSHGFHFYTEEQHAHWCLVSGKKEGGRKRRRQASDKKKKKKRDKKTTNKKQTKDKKPLQNSKNTIQPSTAKVQLSTLHYMTVTDWIADKWRAERYTGKSRGCRASRNRRSSVQSQRWGGCWGFGKPGSKNESALQRRRSKYKVSL